MALKGTAVGGVAQAIDVEEARLALSIIADPTSGCCLQEIPTGRKRIRPGHDLDALVAAALELVYGQWLYCRLNPVSINHPEWDSLRKEHTGRRRFLLIDVDATRPNKSTVSATAEEHAAAEAGLASVRSYLDGLEWPPPAMVIDSGNGYQGVYFVDLPPISASDILLANCLRALSIKFHELPGAELDDQTAKATQAIKLPGSWAKKGPNTPERPHRQVRLIECQDHPQVVPLERLQALAGPLTTVTTGTPTVAASGPPATSGTTDTPTEVNHFPIDPTTGKRGFLVGKCVHVGDHDDNGPVPYARRVWEAELTRIALAQEGHRNEETFVGSAAVGNFIASGRLPEAEVISSLIYASMRSGLSEREATAVVRRGVTAGKEKPKPIPEREPEKPRAKGKKSKADPAEDPGVVPEGDLIIRACDIIVRPVEWLWPGRIPLGKMTTFAGMGGVGKTFVLLDIATRLSRGLVWPGTLDSRAPLGQTLYISGEDDPEDTLVPRLAHMGADLRMISFLSPKGAKNFNMAALKLLTAVLGQIGNNVKLVVIDPPTSYLEGVDDHKNAELRTLLTPLREWGSVQNVSTVFNTHVNKASSAGSNVDAQSRIIGSVAWSNAVRAAHMLAEDPDDPTRCVFAPVKNNLGPKQKTLAYRIKPHTSDINGPATVEWLGEVETTANQAMATSAKGRGQDGGKTKRKVQASAWLIEKFRQQLEWRSDRLFEAAKEAGLSRSAIFEAKATLDLPRARKVTGEDGDDVYIWWVPGDWPMLAVTGDERSY